MNAPAERATVDKSIVSPPAPPAIVGRSAEISGAGRPPALPEPSPSSKWWRMSQRSGEDVDEVSAAEDADIVENAIEARDELNFAPTQDFASKRERVPDGWLRR